MKFSQGLTPQIKNEVFSGPHEFFRSQESIARHSCIHFWTGRYISEIKSAP